MEVYAFDPVTHEHLGTTVADESPLEKGVFHLPAHTTEVKPPEAEANKVAVYDPKNGEWSLHADHRGQRYWRPDGSEHRIVDIGHTPHADALDAPPPPSLATVKATAISQVDRDAEAARLRFITRGVGQALEYEATASEAMAANSAPDPLKAADWPMLEAERAAQQAAGVTPAPTLRSVTAQVIVERSNWLAAGAAVKRTRREAKLKIDAAETVAQVEDILAELTWPAP